MMTRNTSNEGFGLIIVWSRGLPEVGRMRDYLLQRFRVLADVRIRWSEAHFAANAARLYRVPSTPELLARNVHWEKIGGHEFHLFVVHHSPEKPVLHKSASGALEWSDRSLIEAKERFRGWVEERTGKLYQVHSTCSDREFSFQAPLLIGMPRLQRLLAGELYGESEVERDLEGSGGWHDWSHLFDTIALIPGWLVLRNFEGLPSILPDADIDFLADDFQLISSAIGLTQSVDDGRPWKGATRVGTQSVPFDVRFLRDGYFDPIWQAKVIARRVRHGGLFIPDLEDRFFTLLHHALAHKGGIKPLYRERLVGWARELGVDGWFTADVAADTAAAARFLAGYMNANGYVGSRPLDVGVGSHSEVERALPHLPSPRGSRRATLDKKGLKEFLRSAVTRLLPTALKRHIKSMLRLTHPH